MRKAFLDRPTCSDHLFVVKSRIDGHHGFGKGLHPVEVPMGGEVLLLHVGYQLEDVGQRGVERGPHGRQCGELVI